MLCHGIVVGYRNKGASQRSKRRAIENGLPIPISASTVYKALQRHACLYIQRRKYYIQFRVASFSKKNGKRVLYNTMQADAVQADVVQADVVQADADAVQADTMAEDERVCRVCRESSNLDEMIAPCHCRGTMKWIHADCWRQTSQRCVPCGINLPATSIEDDFPRLRPPPLVFETRPAPDTAHILLTRFIEGITSVLSELTYMQQRSPRTRMMHLAVDAFASPFGCWFWKIIAAHIVMFCSFQLVITARTAFA